MKSTNDLILDRLRDIPTIGRQTAQLMGMQGPLAIVNVGEKSVTIPCIGFTPPVPGMIVQLERSNGQLIVTGPAVTLNPIGVISAGGSPKCTVTVDGVDYVLGYRDGYTPTIGDQVEINWATGVIQGKVTATNTPTTNPPTNPGGGGGSLPATPTRAIGSGQFRSRWQSNDVRASNTVSGAWFYGGGVQAALKGSNPSKIEIYLPLLRPGLGACNIGLHGYPSQPGGWTGQISAVPLNPRSGWVTLPLGFALYLRDNGGGIAVTSGNGDNQWAGTARDALSGALRFQGTR